MRSKSTNSLRTSTSTNVIIEDVAPRSSANETCRCSCCPTVSRWCLTDPLGLTVAFITWFLFLYGQCVMLFVVLVPSNYSFRYNFFHLLVIHVLEFLAVSSHCRTMFINPVGLDRSLSRRSNFCRVPFLWTMPRQRIYSTTRVVRSSSVAPHASASNQWERIIVGTETRSILLYLGRWVFRRRSFHNKRS